MAHYHAVENKKPVFNAKEEVEALNQEFARATRGIRDNSKGTQLKTWQVEYAYLVNEITAGPAYIGPKHVDNAKRLISEIFSARNDPNFENKAKQ